MLQPAVAARSWTGAEKVVPPAGIPVPVMVPERVRTPLTTEAVRLLTAPVNADPSGRVPVTGSVVAAGAAAATPVGTAVAAFAAAMPGPKPRAPPG